jgi:hypothetical protein
MKHWPFSFSLALIVAPNVVSALINYANEFIAPDFLLARNWTDITKYARDTIVQGAAEIAAEGPWSKPLGVVMSRAVLNVSPFSAVTSKTLMPPSNNIQ